MINKMAAEQIEVINDLSGTAKILLSSQDVLCLFWKFHLLFGIFCGIM